MNTPSYNILSFTLHLPRISSHPFPHICTVIFVIETEGSGKGVECGLLIEKYSHHHLSADELLRREEGNADSSETGELIRGEIWTKKWRVLQLIKSF